MTVFPPAPVRAVIGLGANLGDARAAMTDAAAALAGLPGTRVSAVSTWRPTAPVGGPPGQPGFFNGACLIETLLAPRALLAACHAIEAGLGRDRARETVRHGPRAIDLDIVLYGNEIVLGPGLRIPHPEFRDRAFVLEPAAEIAGDFHDPETGLPLARLWRRCIAR